MTNELAAQTVVLIGGSAGIGLETARFARGEGAEVVLVGRDPDRLDRAAAEVDAVRTATFDATDPEQLQRFFAELPGLVDHVLVTAGGNYYACQERRDTRHVVGCGVVAVVPRRSD